MHYGKGVDTTRRPRSLNRPDEFVWMGLASMFTKAGFAEIARRSEGRPVMRKVLA